MISPYSVFLPYIPSSQSPPIIFSDHHPPHMSSSIASRYRSVIPRYISFDNSNIKLNELISRTVEVTPPYICDLFYVMSSLFPLQVPLILSHFDQVRESCIQLKVTEAYHQFITKDHTNKVCKGSEQEMIRERKVIKFALDYYRSQILDYCSKFPLFVSEYHSWISINFLDFNSSGFSQPQTPLIEEEKAQVRDIPCSKKTDLLFIETEQLQKLEDSIEEIQNKFRLLKSLKIKQEDMIEKESGKKLESKQLEQIHAYLSLSISHLNQLISFHSRPPLNKISSRKRSPSSSCSSHKKQKKLSRYSEPL